MPFDKITHLILGLSFVCILLTLVAISAQAADDETLPQPTVTQVSVRAPDPAHDLIRKELDAISARDSELAWSLTTDRYQEKFDSDKEFLSHLRFRERPIYNHGSFKFLDQHGGQNNLIQKVEMEDIYGDPVTVIYRLEKQDDGRWLIDSFAILNSASESDPI